MPRKPDVKKAVLEWLEKLQEDTGIGWLDGISVEEENDCAVRLEDGKLVVSQFKALDDGSLEIGKTVAIFELRRVP